MNDGEETFTRWKLSSSTTYPARREGGKSKEFSTRSSTFLLALLRFHVTATGGRMFQWCFWAKGSLASSFHVMRFRTPRRKRSSFGCRMSRWDFSLIITKVKQRVLSSGNSEWEFCHNRQKSFSSSSNLSIRLESDSTEVPKVNLHEVSNQKSKHVNPLINSVAFADFQSMSDSEDCSSLWLKTLDIGDAMGRKAPLGWISNTNPQLSRVHFTSIGVSIGLCFSWISFDSPWEERVVGTIERFLSNVSNPWLSMYSRIEVFVSLEGTNFRYSLQISRKSSMKDERMGW